MGFLFSAIRSGLLTPIDLLLVVNHILSHRSLLIRVGAPYVVGVGATVVVFVTLASYHADIVASVAPSLHGLWASAVELGVWLGGLIVTAIMSLVATVVCAAVAIEYFIEAYLESTGVPRPPQRSFTGTILRGVRDGVIVGSLSLLVGAVIFLGGFLPFLALPSLFLSICLLTWSTADTTLAVAGLPLGVRFRLVKSHFSMLYPVGAVAMATSVIPFGNFLFLPIIYGLTIKRLTPVLLAHRS